MKIISASKKLFKRFYNFALSTTMPLEIQPQTLGELRPKIYVRSIDDGSKLQINFTYRHPSGDLNLRLLRPIDEEVEKTFGRIKLKISDSIEKSSRRKGEKKKKSNQMNQFTLVHNPAISMMTSERKEISPQFLNREAWKSNMIVSISLHDIQEFNILENPPTVTAIALPKVLMAGFPVHPDITTESCDILNCKYEWFRQVSHDPVSADCFKQRDSSRDIPAHSLQSSTRKRQLEDDVSQVTDSVGQTTDDAKEHSDASLKSNCDAPLKSSSDVPLKSNSEEASDRRHSDKKTKVSVGRQKSVSTTYDWECVSKNIVYTATDADVGLKLKLKCTPMCEDISGEEVEEISKSAVQKPPGRCPFEDRHLHTRESVPTGSFRCVTYNLLADQYADTDTARDLLFAHCPPEYLELDYRKQLYLKEILGYQADVICFQEVDKSVFHKVLSPILNSEGLDGCFQEKFQQSEGLATFYSSRKFKFIEDQSIVVHLNVEESPVMRNILAKLEENEKLKEKFMTRSTTLQVSLLQSTELPSKQIIVANTHLYFHPVADNIRLLQSAACAQHLENILQSYREKYPDCSTSLVLCGDFNSCPRSGAFHLLSKGFVDGNHPAWKSNPDELVTGTTLSHNLAISSACGTPQYTNYTVEFNDCLDYIFYDSATLDVTHVVPMPTHEQVIQYTALPNKLFPSDHIALVCTLKWKN